MSTSLSSPVDKLSRGLHNNECDDYKSCLDYISTKDDILILGVLNTNIYIYIYMYVYIKDFNKNLVKGPANIFEFCDSDINRFILVLRKEFHPYKYIELRNI